MPKVFVYEAGNCLQDAVNTEIHQIITNTLLDKPTMSIGLSGGSMPEFLASGLLKMTSVDWSCVHFFFCDERVVPFSSKESNYGIYETMLFSKLLSLPKANVHKITLDGDSVKNVAEKYQIEVMTFFGEENGYPQFDLLLLGIGPDGHTCSLFPNHKALEIEDLVVAPIMDSPKQPPERITLTVPVLNKAKEVIFIVTGESKAQVLKKIIEGNIPNKMLPASLVQPFHGKPSWYLDKDAASLLASSN